MASYQLTITTPQGKIFDDAVESLTVPGTEGSIGVLAKHAPLVASLKPGALSLRGNSKELFFAIGNGIIEIDSKGNALVLCDKAKETQSLEEAEAAKKL